MALSAAPAARRKRAVESFKSAAETIGPVEKDMSLFAVTRGQFSMIDAILHVLDACAPAHLTLWTWTIADYEIKTFTELARDTRVASATLVIDQSARHKNHALIAEWRETFGADSVKITITHAKIATVDGNGLRVCLRGSMNLNFNPRFEQLDVTEGGADFDLVREIEDELPVMPMNASYTDIAAAANLGEAFAPEQLAMFSGVKRWAK